MNDQNASGEASNEIEMLLDGKSLDVLLKPEKKGEQPIPKKVFVRKIPIFDLDELGKAFGKYPLEVACYINEPVQVARRLTDESFSAVFEEGRRLNFTSLKKWFEWQKETLDCLGIDEEDKSKMVNQVASEVTAKLSQTSAK